MIKNHLKGLKFFFLLSLCIASINIGPLIAANHCLDADSIRNAGKANRDELGWKYAPPLMYYSINIHSQNYVRIVNPDGLKVTTTQSADGKCYHELSSYGLLIGSCNLNKSELDKAMAKKYNSAVFTTPQGGRYQAQNFSPEMVILSEARKSDDPGLCSYNLSIVSVPYEEL